jgi:hypothetical protein
MNKLRFIRSSSAPMHHQASIPQQNSGEDFLRQLGTAVQENPLAATLIGLGGGVALRRPAEMPRFRRGTPAFPSRGNRIWR